MVTNLFGRFFSGTSHARPIYYYLYQEHMRPPPGVSAEEFYVRHLLDAKIAADLHYVRHRTLLYDLRLLWQTAWILLLENLGREPRWTPPPETGLEPRRLSEHSNAS